MGPINMRESAIALNEYYNNLTTAGFTKTEALYLLASMISPVGPGVPKENEEGEE